MEPTAAEWSPMWSPRECIQIKFAEYRNYYVLSERREFNLVNGLQRVQRALRVQSDSFRNAHRCSRYFASGASTTGYPAVVHYTT